MATSTASQAVTSQAGEAIPIYVFVTYQRDGKYDISGAGDLIDGICGEEADADLDLFPRVIPNGATCKVKAGAAVTINDLIESDSTGRAITHTSGLGEGVAGKAITAAGGADEIIEIAFLTSVDETA